MEKAMKAGIPHRKAMAMGMYEKDMPMKGKGMKADHKGGKGMPKPPAPKGGKKGY